MPQPPTNQPANQAASVPDSELSKLSPDARATVQAALKASAAASLGGSLAAAEFSRGWVFSRSRPKPEAQYEDQILQSATSMDQATFAQFAANLAALKSKTGGGTGGASGDGS